jgi:transcriptional regulator with XRE-family HTH domain
MPKKEKEQPNKEDLILLAKLGKRVKELRIQKGYTNYEHFAYDSGISRTQYGKYEVGDNLKFLTLIKILKTMNVSLTEFFAEGFEDLPK